MDYIQQTQANKNHGEWIITNLLVDGGICKDEQRDDNANHFMTAT